MRTLKRNKIQVSYYLFNGKTEDTDLSGNYTGEWSKTYLEPVTIGANVSPAQGNANVEGFGIATDYSHIMLVEGTDSPITEDTVIKIGDAYFRVVRKAKSLNQLRYGLKETEWDGVVIPSPPTPDPTPTPTPDPDEGEDEEQNDGEL